MARLRFTAQPISTRHLALGRKSHENVSHSFNCRCAGSCHKWAVASSPSFLLCCASRRLDRRHVASARFCHCAGSCSFMSLRLCRCRHSRTRGATRAAPVLHRVPQHLRGIWCAGRKPHSTYSSRHQGHGANFWATVRVAVSCGLTTHSSGRSSATRLRAAKFKR